MIRLDHQLCAWWAEAFFGREYLGTIPKSRTQSVVQLQFYWMLRNGLDSQQKCSVHEDMLGAMLRTISSGNGFLKAARADSGRSLVTPQAGSLRSW